LSRSALEDTGALAPMEIMMAGSSEDICLFTCSRRAQVTRGSSGAVLPRSCLEPLEHVAAPVLSQARGHMAAPELPLAGRREPLS
jgi:hypothetical protein